MLPNHTLEMTCSKPNQLGPVGRNRPQKIKKGSYLDSEKSNTKELLLKINHHYHREWRAESLFKTAKLMDSTMHLFYIEVP